MAKVPPCDLFGRVEETARSTEQETRAAHSQSLITATKKRGLPPRDRPHKAARPIKMNDAEAQATALSLLLTKAGAT
jgi:hypothetical protein